MRGAYTQFTQSKGAGSAGGRFTHTIERAEALRKEACELRLARIQNGAEPDHKNGTRLMGHIK